MPPMLYLACITGGGAAFALLIQAMGKRRIMDSFRIPLKVAIAGTFGVALYTVMLAFAFSMAPAKDIGTVNLINYLWPVWMVLLQCLLLASPRRWSLLLAGMAVGFTGLLWTRGFDLRVPGPESLFPFLLALGGGFLWALYSVLLKKWAIPEAQGGTTVHFTTCALIAGLLYWMQRTDSSEILWSPELILWIVFGAVGPVGTAYFFWEIAIKRGNPGLLAALSWLIPVGSSLVLGLLFREALTPGLIPGALLITAGACMVKLAGKSPRPIRSSSHDPAG